MKHKWWLQYLLLVSLHHDDIGQALFCTHVLTSVFFIGARLHICQSRRDNRCQNRKVHDYFEEQINKSRGALFFINRNLNWTSTL